MGRTWGYSGRLSKIAKEALGVERKEDEEDRECDGGSALRDHWKE